MLRIPADATARTGIVGERRSVTHGSGSRIAG